MFLSDGWLVNFAGYRRVLELLEEGEGRGAFTSTRAALFFALLVVPFYTISNTLGFVLIGEFGNIFGRSVYRRKSQ